MCVFGAASGVAQAGVASAVAGELAKQGAKAAIAQFAPDLHKHLDPTSHQLTEISNQLTALDEKLTELIQYQATVEARLACVTQKATLERILAGAEENLRFLLNTAKYGESDRAKRLQSLVNAYTSLNTDQRQLHNMIVGSGGTLLTCARLIEKEQHPYLTSTLAPAVRDFYAAYETAALSLLVVRVNLINYAPELSRDDPDHAIAVVRQWIDEERALIKPAFPNTESYDKNLGLVLKTKVYGGFGDSQAIQALRDAGWYVTGRTYIPTCSAIIVLVQGTKTSGQAALNVLAARNVLHTPAVISCFDDHDKLHDFDLTRFHYTRSSLSLASLSRPSIALRRPEGFIDLSKFSYEIH